MADVFTSIAISPSGSTLLNALQVTTTAGNVLNEVVSIGDPGNGANYAAVLASGAQLVEPGGVNIQPVSGTVTAAQATAANFNATIIGTVTANAGAGTMTVTGAVTIGNAGTVVANAGTNLNTSLLALETGGNLAKVAATTGSPNATAPTTGILIGVQAATQYPTAATNGQLSEMMADKAGRPAVVMNTVRDLVGVAIVSNNSTASGVSFIGAGAAGVFNDIITFVATNRSSTATVVTLTDGTASYTFALAANGGIVINFPTPLPATSTATAWTIGNSATVACDYFAVYAKNK